MLRGYLKPQLAIPATEQLEECLPSMQDALASSPLPKTEMVL